MFEIFLLTATILLFILAYRSYQISKIAEIDMTKILEDYNLENDEEDPLER